MVFADRVEIISPGHLPDSLSIESIRHGKTNRRNPTLTDHAVQQLPYRGMGSGIPRALEAWPQVEFDDDVRGNQFRAVVRRPLAPASVTFGVTTQGTLQVTPPVAPSVAALIRLLGAEGSLGNAEMRERLQLKDRADLRDRYVRPSLDGGWIKMTIPEKPSSRLQKYQLTAAGQELLKQLNLSSGLS